MLIQIILVMKLFSTSSTSSSFLLAPLDFDMSFTETNYLCNQTNKQSFDEIIKLELASFQLTIGGDPQEVLVNSLDRNVG
jgi:hypothetical protein